MFYIDGIDRIGKTSLIKAIHEETNYQFNIFDRSRLSSAVYDKLLRNKLRSAGRIYQDEKIILLYTNDFGKIEKRCRDTNHEFNFIEAVTAQNEFFKQANGNYNVKFVCIDDEHYAEQVIAIMKGWS